MSNLPEAVLTLLTGRDRAAAIMGDLAELATSRGRLWFYISYARTLLAVGWRAGAAFLVALASVRVMTRLYPMWVQHQLHHLAAARQVNMFFGQLAVTTGPLLDAIAMCLWFTLPFAWVLFGRHDRVTRSAMALFCSTLPVFSLGAWLIDASLILTLLVLLAALFSSGWRRPMVVVALTSMTAIAGIIASIRLLALLAHRAFLTFTPSRGVGWLSTAFALGLAGIVCTRLHAVLLRTRPAVA